MLERLEQQKKLTANQWKIIVTANLGDMLDFFDFFLIGYVLAFILKDWQLTYGQSAVILISAGFGAVPGAWFWGWMGDRIGRRKVFILTALNVAFATGMMYFTPDQGGPDVIQSVEGKPVRTEAELRSALSNPGPGGVVTLRVYNVPAGAARVERIRVQPSHC